MSRSLIAQMLLLLALIGLADAAYLSYHAMTGAPLVCDIGAGLDGCNTVATSPYSQVAGIPLAYIGSAFYLIFLLVVLMAGFAKPRRVLQTGLVVLAALAALASVAFLYIQFALIKALCIYCVLSAILTFFSLPLALLLRKRLPEEPAVVN